VAAPRADLPAERWAAHDLSILDGCWLLGHEVRAQRYNMLNFPTEQGMTRAGRICLDKSGRGEESSVSDFPSGRVVCNAPISATFGANGALSITRPAVTCSPPQTTWLQGRLECTRRDDQVADCVETGQHGSTNVEFRRAR